MDFGYSFEDTDTLLNSLNNQNFNVQFQLQQQQQQQQQQQGQQQQQQNFAPFASDYSLGTNNNVNTTIKNENSYSTNSNESFSPDVLFDGPVNNSHSISSASTGLNNDEVNAWSSPNSKIAQTTGAIYDQYAAPLVAHHTNSLFSNGQNGIQEQNQQQPLAPGQIQNQLSHDAILNLDGGDIDIDAIFSSPSEIGDIQIKEESLDGDLDDDDLIDDIINSGSHRPSLPTPTDSASLTSPLSDSSPAGSTQKKRLDKSKFSTNSKNVATSNTKVTKVKRERTTHNVIEKKYRTNINSKIIALRDSVPSLRAATTDSTTTLEELEGLTPAVKLNKAIILSKATEYIKFLETKNTALINELMILRSSLNSHGPPPIGHAGPGMQHSGEPVAPNVVPQVVSHPHMAQHNMGPVPPQMVYMGGPAPPQIITNDSTVSTNDSMMNNNSNYNSTLMNNGGNNSSLNSSQAYDIPNNRDMSLGNKLLVGGMTALVGSQMFGGMTAGGSFDNGNYQYRDLSFIPIFKLLPILENENFVKFFDIIRILLFVCGIYAVFEPLLTFLLNYFDPDAEKKQVLQVDSKTSTDFFADQSDSEISNFDILRELVKLTGYNLGFVKYSLNEKLEHITEFNKKSDQWFFKRLDQYKNTKLIEGSLKSIILNYVKSLSFEDRTIDTLLSDITIQFQFKRIILTKIIMLKLNPLLVKFLGLQKILDRLVLNLLKVDNMVKTAKNNNKKVQNSIKIDKNSENILNLISNDIEFIESDELFEKLLEILRLNNAKSANTNKSHTNGDSTESGNSSPSANANNSETSSSGVSTSFDDNYSAVKEFLYNTVDDDLNVVNVVCVIRGVQILKNFMVEYLTLITVHQFGSDKENESDIESEEDEEQEGTNEETEDASLDETDKATIDSKLPENVSIQTETDPSKKQKKTVLDDIVKSSTHILNSLNSKQMIIPDSCKKLIKCKAIFKCLLNPVDSNNVNEAYSLILDSAKKLIDYYDVLTLGDAEFFSDDEDNANEYISTLNIKNSVISKIVAHNATAQKFAAHGNSFQLITYENRLSLTCAIILHYYSTKQFEKGRKLIKHLVMNNDSKSNSLNTSPSTYNCLTLLSFISTFLTIMVILENDKSVLNGMSESDSEEKGKAGEDENSSEYSKELDEATYLNKTTLENNLAFMRLYIGSAHLLNGDQKFTYSSSNSKINGHDLVGSDVTSLDIYLKREISNKLVNLAKELTGYESYN